jgi:hypothetical protein
MKAELRKPVGLAVGAGVLALAAGLAFRVGDWLTVVIGLAALACLFASLRALPASVSYWWSASIVAVASVGFVGAAVLTPNDVWDEALRVPFDGSPVQGLEARTRLSGNYQVELVLTRESGEAVTVGQDARVLDVTVTRAGLAVGQQAFGSSYSEREVSIVSHRFAAAAGDRVTIDVSPGPDLARFEAYPQHVVVSRFPFDYARYILRSGMLLLIAGLLGFCSLALAFSAVINRRPPRE